MSAAQVWAGKGGEGQQVFYNLLAGLNLLSFAMPNVCAGRFSCIFSISATRARTGAAAAAVPLAAISAAPFYSAALVNRGMFGESSDDVLQVGKPGSTPVVTISTPDTAAPGDTVSLGLSITGCAASSKPCSPLTEDARVIIYVVDEAWMNLIPPDTQQPLDLTKNRFSLYREYTQPGSTIQNLVSVESVRAWPQVHLRGRHDATVAAVVLKASFLVALSCQSIFSFCLCPLPFALCVPCLCRQQVLEHICHPRAQVKAKVQALLEANPWYYNPDSPLQDQSAQYMPLDVMLKNSSSPIHVVKPYSGIPGEFADSGATGSPGSIFRNTIASLAGRGSPRLPDGNAVCSHTSLSGSVQ
jgi:hypothetical protein